MEFIYKTILEISFESSGSAVKTLSYIRFRVREIYHVVFFTKFGIAIC